MNTAEPIYQLTREEREYILDQITLYAKAETPSELAVRAAYILNRIYRGLHHCVSELRRTKPADWANPGFFCITVHGEYATWDTDQLTRLVVLAHDLCVRVSIEGVGPGYMRLMFHLRAGRDGRVFARHPSMEESVVRLRSTSAVGAEESGRKGSD